TRSKRDWSSDVCSSDLGTIAGMKSWPVPSVPSIPGTAAQLSLYDSADEKLKPVHVTGDTATMYVCGITPYDSTHLGHAATYVTFDVIYRMLLDQGHARSEERRVGKECR